MTQWVNSSTGLSTHGTRWWYKIKKNTKSYYDRAKRVLSSVLDVSLSCGRVVPRQRPPWVARMPMGESDGALLPCFSLPSIYLYGKLLLLLINYWYNDTLLRRLSSYLHRTWVRLRVREESQWQTTRDASKATMDGVESSCLLSMWGPLWDNHSHTWHSTCLAEVLGAA